MPYSPSFDAYQGFHRLFLTGEEMREYLNHIYRTALKSGFANPKVTQYLSPADKKAVEKHKSIRLLGTFFSDSFDPNLLRRMVREAHKGTFEVKILMLDPYRDVAKKRADALGINAIVHVKRALKTILEALNEIYRNIPSVKNENPGLLALLKDVHNYGPKSNVWIRFYHSLTDSPIYLMSQYAIKGLILEGVTSEKKPWMVFIDSISQRDDKYDQYSNNFDLIFNNFRVDSDGIIVTSRNGDYVRDANHSREWPIGLDVTGLGSELFEVDQKAKNPDNSKLKEELINLLKKDDLIQIIEKYFEFTGRESLKSELLGLWGRLERSSLEFEKGLISSDEVNLERNKIRSHLIQLILQL